MKDRSPDRGSADPMASDVPDLLRHTEGLRRLVRSLVRDGAEAEDVVQETMTVALRRIGRGEGDPGSAPAWLAGVARNLVRSRRRDRARRLEREGRAALDAGSEPSPSPDEDLELVERQRDLLRHVGALPAAQRRAVLARYYEGRTPAEIAAASGEPVATVKSRIHRGLERLREALDGEYGDRRSWAVALAPLAATSERAALPAVLAVGAAPLWIAALVVAILGAALLLDRSASNSGHPTLGAFPGDVEVARAGGESIDGPIERLDGDGPRREEVAPDATIPSSDVATRPAPLSTVRLADVASEESGPRGELEVLCLQDGSSAPAPGWPLTVTSLDARWLPRSVRRRDADAQGRARWADLPAGRYAVEGQRFEVAAGRRSRVEVAVPWSSTLRGRVVDGDGRPVGGARVLGAPGPPALTDGDGRFEVRGVEQIAWLHAERAGFRRSDVAVLSLAHARGGDEVALTMRRGGAVLTGRLLDADGSPVEGATVRASEQERYEAEDGLDYNQCSYGSVTDREGRFRFGGLLSVPLDLSSNVGPLGSAGLRVDVEAEAEIERDLVLAPRLDVHGVVRDRRGRPVAGASVALYGRDSHEHRFTATDADGRYRVRGAPHPVTHVSSSHDTGGQVRFEPSLSESGVAQLDIELPRDVADLSSSLRGEVLDASGAPLVGWCVYALRDDGWRLIGPTDDEGGFRGVRGTDDLRHLAVSRDERRRFVQVFPDAAIPVGSATLRVTRPFGAIRGRVEDRVGGLPGGATVQLGLGAVVLETRTVEEGAASFEWRDLTPGTYWVRFLAEGRATRVIPVRIEPGETLELGALVSSRGGRLELDVDGPLLAVALDRPGVATPSVRTEPGATTLEALPVGENTVTVFAPGSGVRSIQVVIEEGRTTRSAVALAPGLRREVRVRIDGCPVEDLTWTRPGVLYVLEDAETGAFVVGASAATDGSGVELLPLAAGRYRLRMSTFEGQSGDAVLDVSDRTVAEPVEIDLLSPGL